MKRLILASIIIFSSLFLINIDFAHAQTGSMMGLDADETAAVSESGYTASVEVVLQELLSKQNVSTVQELDLSKISDDEWERLGDAVMELQHPGQAHEVMDQMMGGEGSESLRQMHINMGQAYLGYGGSYDPGMMSGGGIMGGWSGNNSLQRGGTFPMMGYGSMMSYGAYGGYGFFCLVVGILAIAFLASGTYFFLKGAHKK